jgi:polyferredoxin
MGSLNEKEKEETIMATIKKPICTLGIIGIFTFILFIVSAQAEQPIDCLLCANMTMTTVVESGDLIIMGYETKGIVLDNTESKFWASDTVHGVGLLKIDKGKVTGSFINKHMDPNGDFYVLEGSTVGTEYDWKFIYGTGKFKGITGGGKSFRITKGKPVSPGTSQYCAKVTGTYELKQ